MPYREGEIDKICWDCGLVTAGPHAGERIPKNQRGQIQFYKGAPVSDGVCPACGLKYVNEHRHRRGLPPLAKLPDSS